MVDDVVVLDEEEDDEVEEEEPEPLNLEMAALGSPPAGAGTELHMLDAAAG